METQIMKLQDFQNLISNNPIHIISEHGLESWEPSKETLIQEIELDEQDYNANILGNPYPQCFTLFIYKDKQTLLTDLIQNLNLVDFNQGADDDFYDYRPDQLICILRCLELLQDYQDLDIKSIASSILAKAKEYQEYTEDDLDEFELTYQDILDKFSSYL